MYLHWLLNVETQKQTPVTGTINSPHIFNLQQVPFLQNSYFIPWTTHAKTYFLKTKQHGLNFNTALQYMFTYCT